MNSKFYESHNHTAFYAQDQIVKTSQTFVVINALRDNIVSVVQVIIAIPLPRRNYQFSTSTDGKSKKKKTVSRDRVNIFSVPISVSSE